MKIFSPGWVILPVIGMGLPAPSAHASMSALGGSGHMIGGGLPEHAKAQNLFYRAATR
jgi:hypothetical protein